VIHRLKLVASIASCAAALAFAPAFAQAQAVPADYPNKPVTIVVAFSAGQSGDILARALGESLFNIWKKPLIVDNKPGAGGTLGTKVAAKLPADGYNLLLGSSGPLAIGPHMYKDAGYDPRKDFTPIMNVAGVAQVLVTGANSPYKTVQDVIKAAKANPGRLTYASGGSGSTQHMTMELFKQMAGIDMVHVPYKGSAPAYPDVMANSVDLMFDSSPAAVPFVKGGQVRVLAVSTDKRIPSLAEAPTMIEAGVPGFNVLGWLGIVAPAGLSPALQAKLNADLKKALDTESVKKQMANLGMIVVGNTPREFAKYIDSEYAKWGNVVKASGAKAD
jgi:tripartite-type tricarboxylate transporter receptor subunit TctC